MANFFTAFHSRTDRAFMGLILLGLSLLLAIQGWGLRNAPAAPAEPASWAFLR